MLAQIAVTQLIELVIKINLQKVLKLNFLPIFWKKGSFLDLNNFMVNFMI